MHVRLRECLICRDFHRTTEHPWGSADNAPGFARLTLQRIAMRYYRRLS